MKMKKARVLRLTIIQHLVILCLGILLPQAIMGSLLAWQYAQDQRHAIEREAVALEHDRRGDVDERLSVSLSGK